MLRHNWGEPSSIFPLISAHALISAHPQRAPTPWVVMWNKHPSRISAPLPHPSLLTFLSTRDARETCFYYQFISNLLAFNYSGSLD